MSLWWLSHPHKVMVHAWGRKTVWSLWRMKTWMRCGHARCYQPHIVLTGRCSFLFNMCGRYVSIAQRFSLTPWNSANWRLLDQVFCIRSEGTVGAGTANSWHMASRPLCEVPFRLDMLKQHSKLQYNLKVHYNEGLWKHCTVMKQLREGWQILCANRKWSTKRGEYPMTMRGSF